MHKLFDGKECIDGLDLSLEASARFFNLKLARVFKSLQQKSGKRKTPKRKSPEGYPYVIKDGLLAELVERSEFGRIAVVPTVQESLVKPAFKDDTPLIYKVPKVRKGENDWVCDLPDPDFSSVSLRMETTRNRDPSVPRIRPRADNGRGYRGRGGGQWTQSLLISTTKRTSMPLSTKVGYQRAAVCRYDGRRLGRRRYPPTHQQGRSGEEDEAGLRLAQRAGLFSIVRTARTQPLGEVRGRAGTFPRRNLGRPAGSLKRHTQTRQLAASRELFRSRRKIR